MLTDGSVATVAQSAKAQIGMLSVHELKVMPPSVPATDGFPELEAKPAANVDAVHVSVAPVALMSRVMVPGLPAAMVLPAGSTALPGSVRRNVVAEADEVILRRPSASSVASRPSFRTGIVESF
jgi:hypothetical protein